MKTILRSLAVFTLVASIVTSTFAGGTVQAANGVSAIFNDVKGHWAENTILWSVVKGMATGYTDGTFQPNNLVTESEFLALLIRAYKPDVSVADKGHWADNYYNLAKELNYSLNGMNDVAARNSVINRGYVAELIAGTQGFNYSGDEAIRYLLGNGLAKGTDPYKVTIKSYNKDGQLSRAEAVQFIRNVVENGTEELKSKPSDKSNTSNLAEIPTGNNVYGNVEYIGNGGSPLANMDNVARPIAIKFVESIYLKDGKVFLTVPNIPKGYNMSFKYLNQSGSDGMPDREKSYTVDVAESGTSHSFNYYGDKGYITMSISTPDDWGYKVVEFVRISIPSIKMTSHYIGW